MFIYIYDLYMMIIVYLYSIWFSIYAYIYGVYIYIYETYNICLYTYDPNDPSFDWSFRPCFGGVWPSATKVGAPSLEAAAVHRWNRHRGGEMEIKMERDKCGVTPPEN